MVSKEAGDLVGLKEPASDLGLSEVSVRSDHGPLVWGCLWAPGQCCDQRDVAIGTMTEALSVFGMALWAEH